MPRQRPDQEERKQRKLERIGMPGIACPCCGENDWRVLFEHHYFGRKYGPETVWLCANCHAIITDDQEDYRMPIENGDPFLQRLMQMLFNHASLLRRTAEHCVDIGEELKRRIAAEAADQDNKEDE